MPQVRKQITIDPEAAKIVLRLEKLNPCASSFSKEVSDLIMEKGPVKIAEILRLQQEPQDEPLPFGPVQGQEEKVNQKFVCAICEQLTARTEGGLCDTCLPF